MKTPLGEAVAALEAITDPKLSSMRRRDPNCVRYIASDALDRLHELGVTCGGVKWERYLKASGDTGAETSVR
jgi:hypothetical protein